MTTPSGTSATPASPPRALEFLKGHGTHNDFVIVPDPDGVLELSDRLVRALCDRRGGIGGDGVLHVTPSAGDPDFAAQAGDAGWAMDYRNADGSIAEMCGNGVRVFARYLVTAGLAEPGELAVATRAGTKRVRVDHTGDVVVAMGPPELLDLGVVHAVVGERRWAGTAVSMGNPHLAVPVADLAEAGSLAAAPLIDPPGAFPAGVNVEFVAVRAPGRIAVRVYERGVGETCSCGTGACAAAVAAASWSGVGGPFRYVVEVPGGVLTVGQGADGEISLAGDAVLVGGGTIRGDWLARATAGESTG